MSNYRWQYSILREDGRFLLTERGEYAGDFPDYNAMMMWLNQRGVYEKPIPVPRNRRVVPVEHR